MYLSHKSGCHHLGKSTGSRAKVIEIPVKTLDDVIGERNTKVSLVKCDTQGYEAHVLAGARTFLRQRIAPWFMEVWPAGMARAGSSVEELTILIEEHFDWFADCRQDRPLIVQTNCLREHLSGLRKDKFTDLLLIP